MVNKLWMKGRFWQTRGIFVKPSPIKPNENLDNHGFVSNEKKDQKKKILELFIKRGIPCRVHNAHYLKEWKFSE